tara:strand:+ start:8112 stop:8441 length:330 start_codon:yes stop_codon:yes gene_type:complete
MVENQQAYGKNDKRIVFTETDHRHAQLIVKLKSHGMTQAKFFRSLITGYLEGDERIENFILDNGNLSIERRRKVDKYRTSGRANLSDLGLDEDQIDDLFDVIAEEFPDL